jgi:hypothetical protein
MRPTGLIGKLQGKSFEVSFEQEQLFEGYEQKLIRWGCSKCGFYEKRTFKSGLASELLDAYIICRFRREPIDLIGEARSCPKETAPAPDKNQKAHKDGRRGCRRAA